MIWIGSIISARAAEKCAACVGRFCTPCSLTHPVVREIVQDQSGAEGASGVDAASRVADLEQAHGSYIDAAAGLGFCGWEVQLTAAKCPKHTERPIARGAEPVTSRRLLSVTAITHSTSWKVASSSMPRPWLGVTWLSCDSWRESQNNNSLFSQCQMVLFPMGPRCQHQLGRGISLWLFQEQPKPLLLVLSGLLSLRSSA